MAGKKGAGRRASARRNGDANEKLLDVTGTLRTAPCVPALRSAVGAWRAGGYKGITDTTRRLFAHWFQTDHRRPNGAPFRYHDAQREAIETLVYVWEYERVRNRRALVDRYAENAAGMPLYDDAFARYAIKMATGSGKTKVMALAIAWQFLNSQRERPEVAAQYARTFLLVAPNVIVLERLRKDFSGGRIFDADPVVPRDLKAFWDFDCVMRDDGERAHAEGTLFVTNVQQLYDRPDRTADEEPAEMTAVLGARPPTEKLEMTDFRERIGLRDGLLMVLNDEGHHAGDEDNEWNKVICKLHERTPVNMQIDFSATPRLATGTLFPWIVYDYPLKQAILDGIVKRPMRGVADVQVVRSTRAGIRYQGWLVAGVERWKEYVEQLGPTGKRPILFVMLSDTEEADDVAQWLRERYPRELGGDRTLVIHTNKSGEITGEKELKRARDLARDVDAGTSDVGAIVSVLMLREGWDVENVTVVVGLRAFTAARGILSEQAIGRGLRLMFRDQAAQGRSVGVYQERVDIIGNPKFLEFVDDLEKVEDLKLPTFKTGKDPLKIVTIMPVEERKQFDIDIPKLSPVLVRKKTLAEEIASLDVMAFKLPELNVRVEKIDPRTFTFALFDALTNKKEIERQYTIPEPNTAQEVIGFYARRIAERVKLPSQFAALAPKVREFFEKRFVYPEGVTLDDPRAVRFIAMAPIHYLTVETFARAMAPLTVAESEPKLLATARPLSTCPAFPWSQLVLDASHTVFNLVPCDNEFERTFARFLSHAEDVLAFAKLPMRFGFCIEYLDDAGNMRMYHPDWVARGRDGVMYLIETKGMVGAEVEQKDAAATLWCENATALVDIGDDRDPLHRPAPSSSGTQLRSRKPSSLASPAAQRIMAE